MPFEATTVDAVATRLRAAKRFESVEVRKRFASIADPSQITLVIIVDEGPVKIVMTGDPDSPTRIERKRLPNILVLPILRYEDGYGLTYGARLTLPDPHWMGKRSRITFPLSWGGTKQAGVGSREAARRRRDRPRDRGRLDLAARQPRVRSRRRSRAAVRARRARVLARAADRRHHRLAAGVVRRGRRSIRRRSSGDVVLDTRADPILARNAVYGRALVGTSAISATGRSSTPSQPGGYTGYQGSASRTSLEGRGYLGLIGQAVLEGRVLREDSDRPLPPYLQPQLGGLSTLRGFRTGSFVGDTLVAMSAEIVLPLTSPLKLGKLGVSAFIDRGTVYHKGERFSDQTLEQGLRRRRLVRGGVSPPERRGRARPRRQRRASTSAAMSPSRKFVSLSRPRGVGREPRPRKRRRRSRRPSAPKRTWCAST